jgi:hypothetical protein
MVNNNTQITGIVEISLGKLSDILETLDSLKRLTKIVNFDKIHCFLTYSGTSAFDKIDPIKRLAFAKQRIIAALGEGAHVHGVKLTDPIVQSYLNGLILAGIFQINKLQNASKCGVIWNIANQKE